MWRTLTCVVLTLALYCWGTDTIAREREPFLPVSDWTAGLDGDYCTAERKFERKGKTLWVKLRFLDFAQSFDLVVTSRSLKGWREGMTYSLTSNGEFLAPIFVAHERDRDGNISLRWRATVGTLFDITTDPDFAATQDSIDTWFNTADMIKLKRHRIDWLRVETGPFNLAREAAKPCVLRLIKSLGLDPHAHQTLRQTTWAKNVINWGDSVWSYYPYSMIQLGKDGLIDLLVMVDLNGKPTSCKAISDSTRTELANETCDRLLKFALFNPALNETGQPVDSYYVLRLTFDALW